MTKKSIFFLIFVLVSCTGVNVYRDDGTKKRVKAIIRTGVGDMKEWIWNNNYQIIEFGVIDSTETFVFFENKTYASYCYYCEFQTTDFGEWKKDKRIILLKETFFERDSLISLQAYYSKTNVNKDYSVIRLCFNSYEGFIPTLNIYDSIGNISDNNLAVYNNTEIKIKKYKLSKISISGWRYYTDTIKVIPRDTILLIAHFVKKKKFFKQKFDLSKRKKIIKKNGVEWYVMKNVELAEKVFDGAKLLLPKTEKKESNDSIIYLNFEIPH